jgi:hypothetical protein
MPCVFTNGQKFVINHSLKITEIDESKSKCKKKMQRLLYSETQKESSV